MVLACFPPFPGWKRLLVCFASLKGSQEPRREVIEISKLFILFISSQFSLQVVVNHNSYNICVKHFKWSFKGCGCLVWVWYEWGLIIWGFIHLGSIALIFVLIYCSFYWVCLNCGKLLYKPWNHLNLILLWFIHDF